MTLQLLSPRNRSSTLLFDCPETLSLRALTRLISTCTSLLTTKPYSAPRRATWVAYALATSVFVGIHPVFTHAPPNLWRSIMATAMPAAANRAAKDGPAWPVPMDDCIKIPRQEAPPSRKIAGHLRPTHRCSVRRAHAPDDNHVVVVHCGSSSPDCSRTMYSAYQSGQFLSACPIRASC